MPGIAANGESKSRKGLRAQACLLGCLPGQRAGWLWSLARSCFSYLDALLALSRISRDKAIQYLHSTVYTHAPLPPPAMVLWHGGRGRPNTRRTVTVTALRPWRRGASDMATISTRPCFDSPVYSSALPRPSSGTVRLSASLSGAGGSGESAAGGVWFVLRRRADPRSNASHHQASTPAGKTLACTPATHLVPATSRLRGPSETPPVMLAVCCHGLPAWLMREIAVLVERNLGIRRQG